MILIIRDEIKEVVKGDKLFSFTAIVLANGMRLEFLPEDYPRYISEGDDVEINYREESGGSEKKPRITISRLGLSNNPVYASNLPAENIS